MKSDQRTNPSLNSFLLVFALMLVLFLDDDDDDDDDDVFMGSLKSLEIFRAPLHLSRIAQNAQSFGSNIPDRCGSEMKSNFATLDRIESIECCSSFIRKRADANIVTAATFYYSF